MKIKPSENNPMYNIFIRYQGHSFCIFQSPGDLLENNASFFTSFDIVIACSLSEKSVLNFIFSFHFYMTCPVSVTKERNYHPSIYCICDLNKLNIYESLFILKFFYSPLLLYFNGESSQSTAA